MQSPISRFGGKRLLAKTIINQFPTHKAYCEPFCGAAWVFYAKSPSKVEILNDIDGDLIAFYRCVVNHTDELIRCLSQIIFHRDIFYEFRHKDRSQMTDIQRAVAFIYTTKLSFGARAENYCPDKSKPKFNQEMFKLRIEAVYNRLKGVCIENKPYEYVINRYDTPEMLFYLDPPYVNYENDYGKGLFYPHDHIKLYELLSSINGKFCLSINDVPEMRELYKGYTIQEVATKYMANTKNGHINVSELLITNY